MNEPTGYGPDYYKSESALRAELAAMTERAEEAEDTIGDQTDLERDLADAKVALEAANARIEELEGARWDGTVPPEEEIRQSKRMLFIQVKALQLSSNNKFARAERAEARVAELEVKK